MNFTVTDKLIKDLGEFHTEITEVTYIEERFTTAADTVFEGLGKMTRVVMVSRPSESSHIKHEIILPENWNGCFLGTGNGGMAGHIQYASLFDKAKKGYAAINTDMGTSGGRGCGYNNPEVLRDYGWRSTYIMTRVGKMVTEAFYGRKIERSYFFGISTGGQQSLMLAQRYPEEYDGIIAGVPANNRVNLHVLILWAINAFKKMSRPFEESEVALITELAVEYSKIMGTSDEGDLFVSRPRGDSEYVEGFIAYLKEKSDLTQEQLDTLLKVYTGPIDPRNGRRIYNGYPIGTENVTAGFLTLQATPLPRYTFAWTFGVDYTGEDFDYGDDLDRMHETLAELPANDPDLTPFFDRGGKLFIYSGSADPMVPFPDVMKYYDRVIKAVGDSEKVLDHARYFLIPGHTHGAAVAKYAPAVMNGSIEIKDTLEVLRLWCEEGVVPENFDVVTEVKESRVTKRIYAYCTENNPSMDYPTCDESFM